MISEGWAERENWKHHIATTGGSYYETNQYGAQMLRQAINHGYEYWVSLMSDKL